jgi:hypothetical protein
MDVIGEDIDSKLFICVSDAEDDVSDGFVDVNVSVVELESFSRNFCVLF